MVRSPGEGRKKEQGRVWSLLALYTLFPAPILLLLGLDPLGSPKT